MDELHLAFLIRLALLATNRMRWLISALSTVFVDIPLCTKLFGDRSIREYSRIFGDTHSR